MKLLKSIIALSVLVLIPLGIMVWIRIHQSTGFAGLELIVYPLLFGGASILMLCLIKKYFLKEPLTDFNAGAGNGYRDLHWGLLLAGSYFVLFYVERLTLSRVLRFNTNTELLGLLLDMRQHPVLLLLWFGPVLWIGIALYEELIRVFFLTALWKWSSHKVWSWSVILISAVIFGLVHGYQGSYGMVTIALSSLISGYFFFRKKRLMPLVYAHVLYDGLQVAALLLVYPQP